MRPLTDEEIAKIESEIGTDIGDMKEYIKAYFTQRELRLLRNCQEYANDDPAGLPGHNLIMLIDKLTNYFGGLLNMPLVLDHMIDEIGDENEPERA